MGAHKPIIVSINFDENSKGSHQSLKNILEREIYH